MEKASMKMDLDEWEFLPDTTTFVDIGVQNGKSLFSKELCFNPRQMIDMNYFICPSEDLISAPEKKQPDPAPAPAPAPVDKKVDDEVPQRFKDIGVVPPVIFADRDAVSQVFFKLKEDEFVDMKMDSPKSSNKGIVFPQIQQPTPIRFEEEEEVVKEVNKEEFSKSSALEGEKIEKETNVELEKKQKPCCPFGLSIWRWRLGGIGALCSIGVAAATICIFILGGRQRQKQQHQNQRLQFQIYADDKRIKQVMQQATRLNQALSAARGVPMTRAHISFGGHYDGL